MNTINGLFDEIVSEENIEKAILNAAKGKRRKIAVRRALQNLKAVSQALSLSLKKGTWRPCYSHRTKEINDGITLKKREIVCPHFTREQVVHHAILQVLKPYFIKRFYKYSCASVPGRGVEYAIKYIRKSLKDYKGTKYFTVIDIKKFFNNIRPSKVFHQLRRIIRDKKTLMLLARILRANKICVSGEYIKRGTPIGFYTSPWFANILLTPLDNIIKEDIKYYVRYNDDMLLFSSNKRKLKKVIGRIIEYLAKIKLSVKAVPQIHMVSKVKISYIGATISREKIVLKPKVFLKSVRTARRIKKKGHITIYDAQKLVSYGGRFRHYDTHGAFIKYIENLVPHSKCRRIISERSKRKCGLSQVQTKNL